MTQAEPRILDTLGGKRAIMVWPALLLLPLILFSVVAQRADFSDSRNVSLWIWASVIGTLGAAAVIITAKYTYFKNSHIEPLSYRSVLFVGALAGAVKGFGTGYASYRFELIGYLRVTSEIVGRTISSAIIGAFALFIIALVLTMRDRYQIERRKLILEKLALESGERREKEMLDNLGVFLGVSGAATFTAEIAQIKSELTTLQAGGIQDDWKQISDRIEKVARDYFRPLSHSLWAQPELEIPRVSIAEVFGRAFRLAPFHPWAPTILTVLPTLLTNTVGLGTRVYEVLIVGVTTFFAFKTANKIQSRFTRFRGRVAGFLVVGIAFFEALIVLTISTTSWPETRSSTINILIWIPLVTVVASVIRVALAVQDDLNRELRESIDIARLEAISNAHRRSLLSRELAQYVHGGIQSQLLTLSAILKSAQESGDQGRVDSAISAALDVLNNPPQEREGVLTSLHERVEVVALRWRDFLSIELSLFGDDVVEPKVAVIAQAVEEGITNSFRHGKATHITISIERMASSLLISIIDNGVGPSGGIFGIGSQTFDLLTGGDWALRANASAPGSTLILNVTLTS
ncbi:MAG: hypothetical protein CK545_02825 [Actinobacteria bacterium]|nr:MAG: hypothetical protein CK545_02825 [Actinomycetota bacterium]